MMTRDAAEAIDRALEELTTDLAEFYGVSREDVRAMVARWMAIAGRADIKDLAHA